MGPSGSGKSTLLYILGALDAPSGGTVTLDGQNPYTLNEREQAAFRNRAIGFVFQDHSLLPQCSVLENVLTPTLAAPPSGEGARDRSGARPRAARPRWTRRSPGPPSRGALWRGEAAGGARARADTRSAARAVRRADRQPRSRVRRNGGVAARRPAHDTQDHDGRRDAQRCACRTAFPFATR